MKVLVNHTCAVKRSARVLQLEGLFDVPPTQFSETHLAVDMPIEQRPWRLGLIVGASGSGKTSVARQAFAAHFVEGYQWASDASLVDDFPTTLGIQEITGVLSSVGFSSPPSWLRPFRALSNGEQFRVTLARALCEERSLIVFDEFTSVVDRQVAKIGSAAVAKTVRRMATKQFVAVSCHYDIAEWLDPDWILEMPAGKFSWRLLRRRPQIQIEVARVHHTAWELFRHHHYLDTNLNKCAICFVAFIDGAPVAFASSIHMPGANSCWREHRTVCLPDYQGVGIGNALSAYVASIMVATGKGYSSLTGNPAMIAHRHRSPLWSMSRAPSRSARDNVAQGKTAASRRLRANLVRTRSDARITASFKYIGPPNEVDARRFGVIQ